MDLGVRGRGYLLVGGTSGMGLATAHVLAADGADLVLVGRNADRARAAADEVRSRHGARVHPLSADVSRRADADRMIDDAIATLGSLAGLAVLTGLTGHQPIEVFTDDDWHAAVDDVLLGTVHSVRAALPHLADNGGGTIVTTSAYSIRAPHAVRLPYTSLKGAVAVFTKGVANEYGRQGIRANCVCPGAIETEGLHALRAQIAGTRDIPYDEALERVMVDEWGMHVALGRPGQPHEVGELMAFLLSPRAGYLTGALINIDGGTDF
jgi:NAD(P)-dependent dehydrogenase (short-subunit alcohol dehydrogenase family)